MKKNILLFSVIMLAGAVYAFPNVDMTVGGMPFAVLQETIFEKEEYSVFDGAKNSGDSGPIIKRLNSERNLRKIKQPANINLHSKFIPATEDNDSANQPNIEVIQENGKFLIKPVN